MISNIFFIYALGSISVFLGTASKSWATYHDIYDASVELVDNRTYSLISYNFLLAAAAIFVTVFMKLLFGGLNPQETKRALESTFNNLADLFFSFLMIGGDVGINEMALIPIPLYFRFLSYAFRQKVAGFSILADPPTLSTHKGLITAQALVFFAAVYLNLIFIKDSLTKIDSFMILLGIQFSHCIFDIILDVARHFIYLSDRANSGNSQTTFFSNLFAELIIECLHITIGILFCALQIYKSENLPFYIGRSIYESVVVIKNRISTYSKFKRLLKVVKERLPDITQEDLEHDSICIFCRIPMEIGTAKKLPCGHCLHLECLERWIGQQVKCPVCSYDLSQVLNQDPNQIKKDEEQNQNNDVNLNEPLEQQEELYQYQNFMNEFQNEQYQDFDDHEEEIDNDYPYTLCPPSILVDVPPENHQQYVQLTPDQSAEELRKLSQMIDLVFKYDDELSRLKTEIKSRCHQLLK